MLVSLLIRPVALLEIIEQMTECRLCEIGQTILVLSFDLTTPGKAQAKSNSDANTHKNQGRQSTQEKLTRARFYIKSRVKDTEQINSDVNTNNNEINP